MKRLLLTLTLALAASVPAFAQKAGRVEVRDDDFVGPVRTVRAETATYVKRDGVLVEGPRKLSYTLSYSEDGKRREEETYAVEGRPRGRTVTLYDDAGRTVGYSRYSESGQLIGKTIRKPDEGETLIYYGDGTLRQRSVAAPRGDGTTEVRVYNAYGALEQTLVYESGKGDGTLYRPPVVKRDGMTVSTAGPRVKEYESVVVKPDGTRLRTRERRERDEHGNGVKLVRCVWDADARDFVPTEVFYLTITYYR